MSQLRIGIIGVGNISGIYFKNLALYKSTTVVAVADLDQARAREVADRNGIALTLNPDELVAHPDVDLVLNLTIPKAHVPVGRAAVQNGKHVYSEKPFGVTTDEGQVLLQEAKEKNVLTGCAPDTFLGAGIQTCRKLIDEGAIGDPVGANAFMLCRGHESWHPSPAFYYERGGGPMMDMGPYYLTALVNLLGSVRRVTGSVRATFPTRTITSQTLSGTIIPVETPTHLVGVLDFANGAIGQITTSFDVYGDSLNPITIYGTEGTLWVPDPNGFGGEIKLSRHGKPAEVVDLTHGFGENARGVGVLDMAKAIQEGRPHRASGELAFHVLDIMQSIETSSNEGRHIELSSGVDRPVALGPTEYSDEVS